MFATYNIYRTMAGRDPDTRLPGPPRRPPMRRPFANNSAGFSRALVPQQQALSCFSTLHRRAWVEFGRTAEGANHWPRGVCPRSGVRHRAGSGRADDGRRGSQTTRPVLPAAGAFQRDRYRVPVGLVHSRFLPAGDSGPHGLAATARPESPRPLASSRARTWPAAIAAVVLASAVLGAWLIAGHQPVGPRMDALSRFWTPVLASSSAPLLCIGDAGLFVNQAGEQSTAAVGDMTIQEFLRSDSVRYTDAATLVARCRRTAGARQAVPESVVRQPPPSKIFAMARSCSSAASTTRGPAN